MPIASHRKRTMDVESAMRGVAKRPRSLVGVNLSTLRRTMDLAVAAGGVVSAVARRASMASKCSMVSQVVLPSLAATL